MTPAKRAQGNGPNVATFVVNGRQHSTAVLDSNTSMVYVHFWSPILVWFSVKISIPGNQITLSEMSLDTFY